MTIESRILSVIVNQADEPIYAEYATTVTIVDEAGGEYVEVSQAGKPGMGKIAIDRREWPTLRAAINRMIQQCREAA